MVRLKLLGGVAIDAPDLSTDALARHRHPLTVLALLATAEPQATSRERVMALLWPESAPDRASNSLRQTLFRLRRDLGEDIFLPQTAGGLRLNSAATTVDLWDFREAMERSSAPVAVETYGGPFLDGFTVPGGSEISHWVDAERKRLAQQYVAALDSMARAAEAEGRYDDAVEWRRRQAAADPFSARIALGLLETLIAAGDRSGALAFAAVHESLVRLHLEAAPDPAITELVKALRQDPPVPGRLRATERPRSSTDAIEMPPAAAAPPAAATPARGTGPTEPASRSAFIPGRWLLAAAALAFIAVAAVVVAVAMGGRAGTAGGGGEAPGARNVCDRHVPEASSYTLVYALAIPEDANYQDGTPPYATDSSRAVGSFDRVAYCMQLDDRWVWVSMDAFTDVVAQIGVPVAATGETFQQMVENMNVFSNVPGVVTGSGITTGNMEFWHHCYDETRTLGLPGASGTVHDYDDVFPHPRDSYPSCYGSMQIHNHGAMQTVFAYNQWDRDPAMNIGPDDVGIGNAPGIHSDWTFEANATQYEERNMYILIREDGGRQSY